MARHLRRKAPYAPDVLLPGDPGRALVLAQHLLTEPKMSNHHRGLWGYTGETEGGRPLSIQSTGMGGPSAAIVLHELAEEGVRRALRVGTCGALDESLSLGELLCAAAALPRDGASAALGAHRPARPDPALLERLSGPAEPATVVSTDLFYETDPRERAAWVEAGARAVEMETASLFALGRRLGVAVASLLVVSDVFPGGERRVIDDDSLLEASLRMGEVASSSLDSDRQP
ncbi:MAG: purine-nucleoside phosphorylase [Solirubrobacterales bacterium]